MSDWPPQPGALLAVQHHEGANNAYRSAGTGPAFTYLTVDAAGATALAVSYTPPVDAWWDLHCHVGLVRKDDAAYHYATLALLNTAGAFPAVGGFPAVAQGTSFANAIRMQHSGVQTYEPWAVSKVVPLSAGVLYTVHAQLQLNLGNWSFSQHGPNLWLQGKAYAR